MNKFLRTASTQRLLATIAGFIVAIAAGTAIAIAAQGNGPVPAAKSLPTAIHDALAAPSVPGIDASISFTNRLIDTAQIQGSDPLLGTGSGHIWVSNDGRLRLELYGSNGDPAVVVNQNSFWVADPTMKTLFEGTLPAMSAGPDKSGHNQAVPSVTQIQAELGRLAAHLNVSGAVPTDVGGEPAYTVTVSPKQGHGLLGQAQLAWDALNGAPLRFAVYARGDSTPVIELAVTGVKFSVNPSVFNVPRPTGLNVVKVAMPAAHGASAQAQVKGKKKGKKDTQHQSVSGVRAVARQLKFKLAAPGQIAGRTRGSTTLLDSGGHPGALVVYGQGLDGIAVIEQAATANSAQRINLSSGSGDHAKGVTLPTFKVHNVTGQELDTALGTLVRFSSGGVTYTVIGSVTPRVARAAARAL